MVKNLKSENNYDYFHVCKNCKDEECCADPYFTFCANNEIEKIKKKIKKFSKKFHNFLEIDVITYKNEQYQWYGIKKVNGRCIFLKDRRICLIHDVKPLHCRSFPMVWRYEEEGDKLFIYIDETPDCSLVTLLSKNRQWIENMKRIIITEVQKMSIIDRIAYSSLESDDILRLIELIHL